MTTKVFYAGEVPGSPVPVLSIYKNPPNSFSSDAPILQPYNNLDRVYYDSRFKYFNIIQTVNFTKPFISLEVISSLAVTKKGKTGSDVPIERNIITTLSYHNLGYTPAALLYDAETKEAICGHNIVQNVGNSFRVIGLTIDSNFVYMKEKIFVYRDRLPSLTKKYTLLIFKQSAAVPEFL